MGMFIEPGLGKRGVWEKSGQQERHDGSELAVHSLQAIE